MDPHNHQSLLNLFKAIPGAHGGINQLFPAARKEAKPGQRLLEPIDGDILAARTRDFVKSTSAPGSKKTHAIFVLDDSGSMRMDKQTTIDGYNQQVDILKSMADSGGETTVSLIMFSDILTLCYEGRSVDSLEKLTGETYCPDGWTALLDACGAAIACALRTPGVGEADTAILVSVFTDGAENSSKRCRPSHIAECIELLEGTGRFTFTLMGPREHLSDMANMLHIGEGNVAGFDANSSQSRIDAFSIMGAATSTYFTLRSQGATQIANLYHGEHAQ